MTHLYTVKSYIRPKPVVTEKDTEESSENRPKTPKIKKKTHGVYKSRTAANTKSLLTIVDHYHPTDQNAGLNELTRYLKRKSGSYYRSDKRICKLLNRYCPRNSEVKNKMKIRIKRNKLRTPSLIDLLDSWRSMHPPVQPVPPIEILHRDGNLNIEYLTLYEFGKLETIVVRNNTLLLDNNDLVVADKTRTTELYLDKKKALKRFVEESMKEGQLDVVIPEEGTDEWMETDDWIESEGYCEDEREHKAQGQRDEEGDIGWAGGDESDEENVWGGEPKEWWVKKRKMKVLVERDGDSIVNIKTLPKKSAKLKAKDWDGKFESLGGNLKSRDHRDYWEEFTESDCSEDDSEGSDKDENVSGENQEGPRITETGKEKKPDWDGSVMIID